MCFYFFPIPGEIQPKINVAIFPNPRVIYPKSRRIYFGGDSTGVTAGIDYVDVFLQKRRDGPINVRAFDWDCACIAALPPMHQYCYRQLIWHIIHVRKCLCL